MVSSSEMNKFGLLLYSGSIFSNA